MGKKNRSKKKKSKPSNGHRDTSVEDHRKEQDYSKSLDTFGSRKRHLETVDFVYPTDHKGNVAEYIFGNHTTNGHSHNKQSPSNTGVQEETSETENLSTLSINDILNGMSSKMKERLDLESSTKSASVNSVSSHAEDACREHSRESEQPMGHLSGKSVEEVVQDKAGCRPRANSTDGELALPQRGLCDERTVLTKHKWSSTYLKQQRKSSKAVGLTNLGNTVSKQASAAA